MVGEEVDRPRRADAGFQPSATLHGTAAIEPYVVVDARAFLEELGIGGAIGGGIPEAVAVRVANQIVALDQQEIVAVRLQLLLRVRDGASLSGGDFDGRNINRLLNRHITHRHRARHHQPRLELLQHRAL